MCGYLSSDQPVLQKVDRVDVTCLPPASELSERLLSEYMLGGWAGRAYFGWLVFL